MLLGMQAFSPKINAGFGLQKSMKKVGRQASATHLMYPHIW